MRETINDELKIKDIDKIEKINGESLDIVKENVKKLKEIFPEVFCEDKIDFKRLEEVLGKYTDNSDERYRFEWHGKSKAIKLSQIPSKGTLRPCKEESKNWNTTENLYIEGDNLEVLKLLQKSYQGKIKMIYIDPPYNTGNDFIYPDDYSDNLENYLKITGQKDEEGNKISTNSEGGGRYHTNWLNMMYPRLRLARNLLTDDGIIFISIDDNEEVNLKKICDEVFGGSNFLGMLILKTATDNNPSQINTEHEYMMCYAKKKDKQVNWLRTSEAAKRIIEKYKELKDKGLSINDIQIELRKWIRGNKSLLPQVAHYNCVDEKGVYSSSGNSSNPHPGGYMYDIKHPVTGLPVPKPKNGWRWTEKTFWNYNSDGEVEWGVDESTQPHIKKRIETAVDYLRSLIYEDNRATTKMVADMFDGHKIFDNPKPVAVLSRIIDYVTISDSIILDFFSGSSTTAHAVMKLNAEDKGKRKFIMVQLPEECDEKSEAYKVGYKNICEIGKERIRRAGDKIVEENKGKEGIEDLDIGFKVFKLDTSNIKPWNPDYDNLEMTLEDSINNFVQGRTEEDIVYEIMLKYGIDLTYPVDVKEICGKKLFSVGFGALIVCLDSDITLELVNEIIKYKNELNPKTCRVVFRDNGFKTDSVKTNAIETLHRNNIKEIMSI